MPLKKLGKKTGRPARGGDYVRIHFSLPIDLHERLKKTAEKNGRTMNAELIYLLQSIK